MEQQKKTPAVRFRGFDEEWEIVPLGENCPIIMGQSPSSLNYTQNREDDILIQGNADIENGVVVPRVWTTEITKQAKKGDIIMTVRAPVGDIAITDYNAVIGRGVVSIKGNKFIYYNLNKKKLESFWTSISSGSTFESITASDVKSTIIKIPKSKPEQTKIGSFFENLDELLNKHQTQHQKLNALKKAMLGKLFPKQGATVPEIRFKGFTGDWGVKTLGEIGSTFTGLSGKTKKDFGHGKARFVTYMNVFTNAISDKKLIEPIEIDNAQNEVLKGDVFFTTSSETAEEVGMSSVWMEEMSNIYLNSFCFGYRPKVEFDNYYLANMLRSNVFRKKISFLAQGISRYNISKNKVMDLEIKVPSLKEQQQIGNYFKNLDELITKHATQIEKLGNLKKACLSKMFV